MSYWDDLMDETKRLIQERQTIANGASNGLMAKEDYNKLQGIDGQANHIIVDAALNKDSNNPVENKVITSKLNSFDPVLSDLDTRITKAAGNLINDVKNALTTFANSYETLYNINVAKKTPYSPLMTTAKVCFPETGCKNLVEGGRGYWSTIGGTLAWDVYIFGKWGVSGKAFGVQYWNDAPQTIQSIRARTVTVDNWLEQLNWVKNNVGGIFGKVDFMSWLVGAGGYGRPSGTQERDMLNAWTAMRNQYQKWMGKDPQICWDQKWVK